MKLVTKYKNLSGLYAYLWMCLSLSRSYQLNFLLQNSISIDAKDEEIMYLRDIIHKLNSELSRCQNNNIADNQIRKEELGNSGVGKMIP